jgi:hypothetical protein
MALLPKFKCIDKNKNRIQKEFADAFSDTWFLMIVAHLLGIAVGVLVSFAASSATLL